MILIMSDVVLMQRRVIETDKGEFVSVRFNVASDIPGIEQSSEVTMSAAPDCPGLSELKRTMETVEVLLSGYVGKGYSQKLTALKFKVKGGDTK